MAEEAVAGDDAQEQLVARAGDVGQGAVAVEPGHRRDAEDQRAGSGGAGGEAGAVAESDGRAAQEVDEVPLQQDERDGQGGGVGVADRRQVGQSDQAAEGPGSQEGQEERADQAALVVGHGVVPEDAVGVGERRGTHTYALSIQVK